MSVAFDLMGEVFAEYREEYLGRIRSSINSLGKFSKEGEDVLKLAEEYAGLFGNDCRDAREILCDAMDEHIYDEDVGDFSLLAQAFTSYFSIRVWDDLSERFQRIRSERVDSIVRKSQAHYDVGARTPKGRRKMIRKFEKALKKGTAPGPGTNDHARYAAALEIEEERPRGEEDPFYRWFKLRGGPDYFDYQPSKEELNESENSPRSP